MDTLINRAASIVREQRKLLGPGFEANAQLLMECFIELFSVDPSFDKERFILQCCRGPCVCYDPFREASNCPWKGTGVGGHS